MRKITFLFAAVMMIAGMLNAQSFGSKLGGAIKSAVDANSSATVRTAPSNPTPSKAAATYYVNAATGSNRADGLTPATAKKDIQKALDLIAENKQNGAVINVAEGNYLGSLDAGYIEVKNFVSLVGGWNASFTVRDPQKYVTKIEPTAAQNGTNGNKALITLSGLDNVNYVVGGTVKIDGFCLNLGMQNNYKPADPSDPRNGCPQGVETGRMVDDGGAQLSHQLIHSDAAVAGNIIICNCLIANSPYFGIQINTRCGEIEIYNCVIISNRYAGVRIDGWDKNGERSHVNFHHNTVAFSWCRDKIMEDMGYGYEFMCKVNADVHHNIFLCNNYAALARTHVLSGPDAVIEAKRKTNVYDNLFFMNAADLQLPSKGGGKWTNVSCKNFEDVDEKIIPKVDGNKELASGDAFVNVIDQAYLKGFANIKVISSSSFDPNSAANLYRQAHGMNMQGTEINRVSMFGNRYNFGKALLFFGAKSGYGAQKLK
ncbi:MAG: hypothetical protein PUG15_00520 [Bacteroidales bacterium]|nr:hypothetical protein [Bacteroidales bacterium]